MNKEELDSLAERVIGAAIEVHPRAEAAKAIDSLLPIHEAQLLSYLRLGGYALGYLINFHERLLKHGIKRFILTPSPCPP